MSKKEDVLFGENNYEHEHEEDSKIRDLTVKLTQEEFDLYSPMDRQILCKEVKKEVTTASGVLTSPDGESRLLIVRKGPKVDEIMGEKVLEEGDIVIPQKGIPVNFFVVNGDVFAQFDSAFVLGVLKAVVSSFPFP